MHVNYFQVFTESKIQHHQHMDNIQSQEHIPKISQYYQVSTSLKLFF